MDDLTRQRQTIDTLQDRIGVFIWSTATGDDEGRLTEPVTEIDLGETEVCDDDLALLTVFTGLEWLCLEDTRVTDAGLEHLVKLRSLKRVELTGSNVTASGIARLKQELPNCEAVS